VYANPLNPVICPVLSLAVLIFCKPFIHDYHHSNTNTQNFALFDGSNQTNRFSNILSVILSKLDPNEINSLGAKVKEIGTHSTRKGAASYCCGMVSGPSPIQVYQRAGWSLGNIQDRYLFGGNGGDQLTGRVVSGLPNTNTSFSTLPPHFSPECNVNWDLILPCYNQYPNTFKQVVPYLLASLVYHEQWLKDNLNITHPLFSSALFSSGELKSYRPFVLLGEGHCAITKLGATGIPPHLAMANELNGVIHEVKGFNTIVKTQFEQMPKLLTTEMLSNFTVNGAIPVTMDAMNRLFVSLSEKIELKFTSSQVENTNTSDLSNQTPFMNWYWKGRFRMVPENWTLPTNNIKDIWNLWWYGHIENKIQPYRRLKWHDVVSEPTSRSTGVQLAKTNTVMQEIEKVAKEMNLIETGRNIDELTKEECSTLFDKTFTAIHEQLRPNSTTQVGRWGELSIATFYKMIQSGRKKRKREE
jgi:hypothetical protein